MTKTPFTFRKAVCAALFVFFALPVSAFAPDFTLSSHLPVTTLAQKLTEEKKIELLIKYIASLEHAVFIRNGSEHTPTEAADHLKLKRKNAGSAVKTAQDFIDKCATKSSLSGKPYTIRAPDGVERTAAEMLKEELKRIESK